jgi:hypothetical protein
VVSFTPQPLYPQWKDTWEPLDRLLVFKRVSFESPWRHRIFRLESGNRRIVGESFSVGPYRIKTSRRAVLPRCYLFLFCFFGYQKWVSWSLSSFMPTSPLHSTSNNLSAPPNHCYTTRLSGIWIWKDSGLNRTTLDAPAYLSRLQVNTGPWITCAAVLWLLQPRYTLLLSSGMWRRVAWSHIYSFSEDHSAFMWYHCAYKD